MKIHNPESLQKYKTRHNLTNTQLAAKLGLAASNYKCDTVSKMLNGKWEGDWEWVSFKLNK